MTKLKPYVATLLGVAVEPWSWINGTFSVETIILKFTKTPVVNFKIINSS